jgi:Universal stress protein family
LPFVPVDRTYFTPYESGADLFLCRQKLEQLKATYKGQLCGRGTIEISILEGNPRQQLTKYIAQQEMDLVVVGLSKFNLLHRLASSIAISRLARKTYVPVLAVRSSGLVCHFKKIVLPVHSDIPLQRIRLATILARAFKSTVYLVSLREKADTTHSIISNALEIIQSLSTVPVQCFLMEGKNLAQSTLEFSKKINADLIMVNPVKEFRLPGLWNRLTNNLLSYGSNIPVITMEKQVKEG